MHLLYNMALMHQLIKYYFQRTILFFTLIFVLFIFSIRKDERNVCIFHLSIIHTHTRTYININKSRKSFNCHFFKKGFERLILQNSAFSILKTFSSNFFFFCELWSIIEEKIQGINRETGPSLSEWFLF